jgi:hypothetical protein
LVLTQIAREMSGPARSRMKARLVALKAAPNAPPSWPDVLLARAGLAESTLRNEPAAEFAGLLIARSQRTQNWPFLSYLRRDLAASTAAWAGAESCVPGGIATCGAAR